MMARILRSELHPHWGRMGSVQWGVVQAIHPPGTYNGVAYTYSSVDVTLDGSSTVTNNLAFMENYAPMVNDGVVILRMQGPAQTARIVLGSMSPAGTSSNIQNVGLKVADLALGAGTTSFTLPNMTGMNNIKMRFRAITNSAAALDNVAMRFNGDTTANYYATTWDTSNNGTAITVSNSGVVSSLQWTCLATGTLVGSSFSAYGEFTIFGYNTSTYKRIIGSTSYGGAATNQFSQRQGYWNSIAAITSLGFLSATGPGTNSLSGNVEIWLEP